jgi:ABC-type Na+ efflux pump permease subunit
MNRRAILAIVQKDVRVVVQNKGVLIPIIIVPLIFLVLLPALTLLIPSVAEGGGGALAELETFTASMPPGLQEEVAGYDEVEMLVVLALVYFLAPLYLILPLMTASVIAADSFAGEKERKTLEALLYTPTTDRELLVAKLLSAWLPAMAVALIGAVVYMTVANIATWQVVGELLFPSAMWIALVLWVAPAVAGLGLTTMVLVSARAEGFQDAYQIGGAVVIPIVLLVIGQATGVMYFSVGLVLLLGLVLWIIDAVLLWFGARHFRRSRLVARV